MKTTFARILSALCLASLLAAAEPPVASPESVGMSAERLARIGAWLDGMAARKEAAGFVALVARRGKVVYHKAHGHRGLDAPEPMPIDALFDLASMTKPVTVTAALQLLENGEFTLNDPIGDFLPEFRKVKIETAPGRFVSTQGPIRVRHLFSHTSGVFTTRSRAQIFEFPTLEGFMQDLAKSPVRYEPGSTFLYGTSHDVLGYLVQKVSGQPLDRYVGEHILQPLGMTDTHYWPPAEKDRRRAVLVVNGKDDPESLSRVPPAAARAHTYIGGASGLYSTAADYWRFAQMLANGGEFEGKRLLGPRTVAWMAQNHIGGMPSFTTPGTRFGLGLAIVTDPAASGLPYAAGSYYWGGSQGTIFWIDPKEELVGVLMVQLTPSRLRLRERFAALVYSSILQ
ncbi:MAG: serine hydrolase domain-containing protein [Bryobacteraceae bacterium]